MGILPPFHFSISNPVRTVLMLWNNLMLTSECSCGLLDSVKSKLSSYKLPRLSISLRMTDRKSFKKTKSARNWVGYFIWQMSWKYPAYHSHLNDIIEKRQAATFNVSNWAIKIGRKYFHRTVEEEEEEEWWGRVETTLPLSRKHLTFKSPRCPHHQSCCIEFGNLPNMKPYTQVSIHSWHLHHEDERQV